GVRGRARGVRRQDDAHVLVALDVDVGMVVRGVRGFGDAIREGNGGLEALEGEGLRQHLAVTAPARSVAEERPAAARVEPSPVLRAGHECEGRLYDIRT